MTLGRLKSVLNVLLVGDNEPPSGEDLLAALEMAYIEIANNATALKLLTVNKGNAIVRMGPGKTFVRMPKLPKDDTDKLDIDNELVPAVARLIAGYVSDKKSKLHEAKAREIVSEYESKVTAYMEEMERRGELDLALHKVQEDEVL